MTAGVELGHLDGGVVGFTAGAEQHDAIEAGRCRLGEPAGKVHHGAGEHPAEEMVEPPGVVGHDLGDLGVAMAQQ